ncbi:phage tail tube protein [Cetobacterium sp. ZWU0022]|uniref:phage tail tube protein n=1 Tax=Cetobacterium sp. ZWU0022 TaxID=1340502 RepID=UPI0006474563|nr:phage tail tube protein [Cetobacterium sp. ZWU0022]
MSVKVFFGKQTTEGTVATTLLDLGATDFSGGEKYNAVKSEVFNSLQAEGDQFLVGIETSFDTPIEWNAKVLEAILPALGYAKEGKDTFYKLTAAEPAVFSLIVSDSLNNKKTLYKDCKLNTCSLNAVKGALVNGSLSWIGTTAEFTTGIVVESIATNRGESLVAIDSIIELGGKGVTEDVESLTIDFNNNLEARGSIDSLYTKKIRRSAPQSTNVSLEFNSYDQVRFEAVKAKAIANASENLTLTLVDGDKTIMIEVPKLYITTSDRGDYKGAGTHSLSMTASVNNTDNTPAKFTF